MLRLVHDRRSNWWKVKHDDITIALTSRHHHCCAIRSGKPWFEGALVSTGSAPRRLTFPAADQVSTSDQLLGQREAPRRLIIIGGGVVGFDFGQVFARLGSAVHMLCVGIMCSSEKTRRWSRT